MRIGELARGAGVNASAIRYYEKCGLLLSPHRSGGQRRYPKDTLDRVLLIRFASDMGFSLGEIRLFLSGLRDDAPVGARWKNLAHRKIREVERGIERSRRLKSLLEHLLDCHCASLQVCVQRLSLNRDLRLLGGPAR
jgi:MerR family redox-sensitive transcriptional activator SoxR